MIALLRALRRGGERVISFLFRIRVDSFVFIYIHGLFYCFVLFAFLVSWRNGKEKCPMRRRIAFFYFVHFSARLALLVAVFLSIFVEITAEFQMTGVRIILEIILESYSLVTAESVGVSSPSWRFQFNRIAGAFHISHR